MYWAMQKGTGFLGRLEVLELLEPRHVRVVPNKDIGLMQILACPVEPAHPTSLMGNGSARQGRGGEEAWWVDIARDPAIGV